MVHVAECTCVQTCVFAVNVAVGMCAEHDNHRIPHCCSVCVVCMRVCILSLSGMCQKTCVCAVVYMYLYGLSGGGSVRVVLYTHV